MSLTGHRKDPLSERKCLKLLRIRKAIEYTILEPNVVDRHMIAACNALCVVLQTTLTSAKRDDALSESGLQVSDDTMLTQICDLVLAVA